MKKLIDYVESRVFIDRKKKKDFFLLLYVNDMTFSDWIRREIDKALSKGRV